MSASEIQNELLALETGNARHHLGAGGFHLVGQEVIRVNKFSVTPDHRSLALAAGSPAAEIRRIDASGLDRFQHALGRSDRYDLFRAREFDVIWRTDRRGHETFEVDVLLRPAFGGRRRDDIVDQSFRAADVEMRSERLKGQCLPDVEPLAEVGKVEIDAGPEPAGDA